MHNAEKEAKKKFPCVGYGTCCSFIGIVPPDELKSFGLKIKEDGSCTNLTEDMKCSIYENRPDICKISFKKHHNKMPIEFGYQDKKKSYYMMTTTLCNQFMDARGSDYPRIDHSQVELEFSDYP